jgi:amino acid transporter
MEHHDDHDLSELGYAQQLFRTMGGFSNFAVAFSVVSVMTGAITLYDYGLRMGGPAEMVFGWPIVTLFTLFVVLSMGELASAIPTAGTMYHWSCKLGGKGWGWFTAWFTIAGYLTAIAGVDFGCARFLLPMLSLHGDQGTLLVAYALILISHALINHFGIKLVAWLNDFSVTVHIVGIATIIGALLIWAPKQEASFLLSQTTSQPGKLPYWCLFILGLLQAQWTLSGYDSSASVSEETIDARMRAPWGMVIAVAVSGIAGYLLLLALTISIKSIPQVLQATDSGGNSVPAVVAILTDALGARAGAAVSALAAGAMWFCGLAAVTGCSRMMFAFARDGGMPVSEFFARIGSHQTPSPAIWATVIVAFLAAVWSDAYAVITSMSVIGLYLSYITPVFLFFLRRRHDVIKMGPWHLGRFGPWINGIAIVWTVFINAIVGLTDNMRAGKAMLALLIVLSVWYVLGERKRFKGPAWL